MEIDLRQRVLAPPSAVWGWLTDPARMNRWSTARIEPLSPGEGGRMDGVGALRRVVTPGIAATSLLEVVRVSEPGHRFVYVVFDGAPALVRHRGEIVLHDDGEATVVRWRVTMQFALRGVGTVARASIGPELARSLEAMAKDAAGARPETLPKLWVLEDLDVAMHRAEAERVLDAQRAQAARLDRAADARRFVAHGRALLTEALLDWIDAEEVDHPEWVLRWIRAMHEAAREDGPVELAEAIRRHVEHEAPAALTEVFRTHFRGRCELVRLRADWVRLNEPYRIAVERLLERMPSTTLPSFLRVARGVVPIEVGGQMLRRLYDLPAARLAAFPNG